MATKQEIRDYFAKFGKQGGLTRARNMTAAQRAAAARKASEARWAKEEKQIKGNLAEIERNLKRLKKPRKAPK